MSSAKGFKRRREVGEERGRGKREERERSDRMRESGVSWWSGFGLC